MTTTYQCFFCGVFSPRKEMTKISKKEYAHVICPTKERIEQN